MRYKLLATVTMMGFAALPAFAQVSATQSPPSPNASSQMPQPANSMPSGATVATPQFYPGAPLGTTQDAPVVAGAPAPALMRKPMPRVATGRVIRNPVVTAAAPDEAAPPTSAYRGGVGSPYSAAATDLHPSTGERLGSRLPDPNTATDRPRDLLAAAQFALNKGQTGAAQQALEMAETRILSRTTDPDAAGMPDQQAMVQNISGARRALGAHDVEGARQMIANAMGDRVPPRGPATVTRPVGM